MLWTIAKEAAANWSSHRDSRQGAAIAYYSVFSLGPIIVIAIAVAGFFFGREAVTGEVAASVTDMLGDTGAKAVQAMLADAARPREGLLATVLGAGTLLFAAIGVVVQLKDALNTVWEVGDLPGHGVWHFIRSYVVSLAAVLALGFLLLVSLIVTAGLAAFGFRKHAQSRVVRTAHSRRHRRRHQYANQWIAEPRQGSSGGWHRQHESRERGPAVHLSFRRIDRRIQTVQQRVQRRVWEDGRRIRDFYHALGNESVSRLRVRIFAQ